MEMEIMEYKNLTFEVIVEWCKAHGEVQWLKETVNKTYIDDKGIEREYNFLRVKKEFCEKFMPTLLPKKKNRSMRDIVKDL